MKKILSSIFIVFAAVFFTFCVQADPFSNLKENFKSNNEFTLDDAKADHWSLTGKNLICKGNVIIPYGNMVVRADRIIVNLATKDIEAFGNIEFFSNKVEDLTLNIHELTSIRRQANVSIAILGYVTDPIGTQKVRTRVTYRSITLKAQHVSGNLLSGVVRFKDLEGNFNTFFCKAESGLRKPSGAIVVKNASFSSCEYLEEDQAHYSFHCKTARIYPHMPDTYGFSDYNTDQGEHSLWAYGCTMKVMGVPVLWAPMVYKPKDESPGLFHFQAGYNSGWGVFATFSKRFDLLEYPYASVKLFGTYYSLRGFGYGADLEMESENSRTEIFAYSMYDIRPYEESGGSVNDRLKIPNYRYDFRISNVTHITERLDFRGHFEVMSDAYIQKDFFQLQFYDITQPVTYGALEYQFDWASLSLFVRPRVNTFFSTVERLPEAQINLPRQELFKNIYYQGDSRLGYLQMKWREYDKPRTGGNRVELRNYESFRLDSLHMFYYPIKLKWLNIVPRAGVRFTYYSRSSSQEINMNKLDNLFIANQYEGQPNVNVINYNAQGGNQARFIGEFGVEMTTKISRSWQNVRSAYWELDGLRHMVRPYLNYNLLPPPTVSRNKLYYFDDIDRIERQNFVRIGLVNELQTRRGDFGKESIYTWMVLENYLDYHFERKNGFKRLGVFGTKWTFKPHEKLSLRMLLLLDPNDSDDHGVDAENAKKGLAHLTWIDKWETTLSYSIYEDFVAHFSFIYQDAYRAPSTYSMGSTVTDMESGSAFTKFYPERLQNLRLGFSFPITMDRKTTGAYDMYYDFEAGFIRQQRVAIRRSLHCWEMALEAVQNRENDSDLDREVTYSIMFTMQLAKFKSPLEKIKKFAYGQNKPRDEGFY